MSADVVVTPNAPLLSGRYELLHLLGRGGMADVHAARDHALARDVAVKLLRNPADEVHRARFISEARTLAGLQHGNIVALLDAGLDDETPYLVMQLAEGRTLSRIADAGPLDAAYVARIGAQVADGLCHAHAAGVVHRDVKPSNIIVTPDGRARLADFGIARLIGETDRHTRTDETIGSPAYLAPEQVTGADVTAAIDVYSLGLVLLEAVTGRRAYSGTPVEAAIARLQSAPLIPTSLGPAWCALLERMTRLDPAQRPTAAQVAATLSSLTTSTAALEPDELERTGTFSWSTADSWSAADGAVDRLADDESSTSVLTGAPRRRRRAVAGLLVAAAVAAVIAFGSVFTTPVPTVSAETGTPVPDWSSRIFDELFVVPAVAPERAPVADPEATAVRPAATRPSPAPAKGKATSNKDVVPGQADKAKHPGKGTPGKPGGK